MTLDKVNINPLVDYFNTRYQVFTLHMTNTLHHLGEEDLHQLRVETKKLRALIRLAAITLDENFKRKELEKPLLRVFKPGGKLRETHINKNSLANYSFSFKSEYLVYQETLASKYIGKLLKRLEYFVAEDYERLKTRFPVLLETINLEHMIQSSHHFLTAELESIRELFTESANERQIHKIRMHLKAAGYILKLLLDLNSNVSSLPFYQKLKITEEYIGNWHDLVVFNQSLFSFAEKQSEVIDIQLVVNASQQILSDIKKSEKEIKILLSELLTLQPNFA